MERKGNSFSFNKSEKKILKKLIDRKYGQTTTSVDFETTSGLHDFGIEKDIFDKTGKIISGSTVERMIGLAKDHRNIRSSTLEIIAKYLDFKTTLHLINHIIIQSKLVNSDAEQFNLDTFIKSHTLIISLGKDKEIVMRLLEENKFEILHSKNSKLIKYDRIEVTQFDTDEEFICKSIFRKQNNEICNLGQYKSGDNNRIKSISISKMNPV